jgi:hypothetical protein
MLSAVDLILLPYTYDLTPAGIAYACQTLPHPPTRRVSETIHNLRHTVAEQAAELAFRRYLTNRRVPHKLSLEKPFAKPGRVDVVIGGRVCSLQNAAIFRKEKIRQFHQNPFTLLSSPASLTVKELNPEYRPDSDLLVFSFVTGLVTHNRSEITKANTAGHPVCMLYPLPAAWSQPSFHRPVGNIILKSEAEIDVTLTLGGQTDNNRHLAIDINLPPLQRVSIQENFKTLVYLQISEMPDKRLALQSRRRHKTLVIQPHQWGNTWVYGMDVVLAGWITRGEFRRLAHPYPKYSDSSYAFNKDVKRLAVAVTQLHPLESLFTRIINQR